MMIAKIIILIMIMLTAITTIITIYYHYYLHLLYHYQYYHYRVEYSSIRLSKLFSPCNIRNFILIQMNFAYFILNIESFIRKQKKIYIYMPFFAKQESSSNIIFGVMLMRFTLKCYMINSIPGNVQPVSIQKENLSPLVSDAQMLKAEHVDELL